MNEQEWLACEETKERIEFLRSRVSDRKLRLVGCACCHLYWDFLPTSFQKAVNMAELLADGRASKNDLEIEAINVLTLGRTSIALKDQLEANYAFELVLSTMKNQGINATMCSVAYWKKAEEIQHKWSFLHDIIGPLPFRPATLDPFWLTPTVVKIAQVIYDDRAFADLPILADAMVETGCTNSDILAHCRGSGPHVRGCWAVDLVLGKE